MLNDAMELAKIAKKMASSPHVRVRNWQRMSGLCLALGSVICAAQTFLEHYFLIPLDAPFLLDTRSFLSALDKWLFFVNTDLGLLDGALAEFVGCFDGLADLVEGCDAELQQQLHYHFAGGSLWCAVVVAACRSGHSKTDGQVLGRCTFQLAHVAPAAPAVCDRQAAEALLGREEIPCANSSTRLEIAARLRQELALLQSIKRDLDKFSAARQSLARP